MLVSIPGSMAQREPRGADSGHHSVKLVTLLLEKVARAGAELDVMHEKLSIKHLVQVAVKELKLTQFLSLSMSSSCATSAG